MWNITIVDDSMSKQFSKEKGDKMSALPATVGGSATVGWSDVV